jgi:hypothetical protein
LIKSRYELCLAESNLWYYEGWAYVQLFKTIITDYDTPNPCNEISLSIPSHIIEAGYSIIDLSALLAGSPIYAWLTTNFNDGVRIITASNEFTLHRTVETRFTNCGRLQMPIQTFVEQWNEQLTIHKLMFA